jgi:cytochrome c1
MRRLLVLACLAFAGCEREPAALGGDPEAGRLLLRQYGCGTCHEIPRVAGADGKVGPPLAHLASRVYLAGRIANTPQNLAHWIRHPQAVDPRTAMPDMQVTEAQARDMVAYLYTLK